VHAPPKGSGERMHDVRVRCTVFDQHRHISVRAKSHSCVALPEARASYSPWNARRRAAHGRHGLVWVSRGFLLTCIAWPSPTHRHRLARAVLTPQAHPLTLWRSCMPCNFIRCRQRAVLSTGGEGLRSPSPCRSGKAPAAVAAAFLPPLVARTAKALSVGAELPASGSSSGKPGERAGAAGAAGAGGECGGSQAGQVADRGAPAG
jgi:hypothetical protein